jgi:hypothetical protein
MSQETKSALYQALKAAGTEFSKHYREYTTEELSQAYHRFEQAGLVPPLADGVPEPDEAEGAPTPGFFGIKPENEMAGQRLNTKHVDEVLYVDDDGKEWLQVEVPKPAAPKPRGRRVLTYSSTGTKEITVPDPTNPRFTETFEVPGDEAARDVTVKITLPSYQVGIYRIPSLPFKVVVYGGEEAFSLEDVEEFYGGANLVPPDVKRAYVANVLAYNIRSVVQAIEAEDRRNQLTGGRNI